MRRGLISHSKAELSDAVLEARISFVRAAMREAGHDALLLYSNNTRPAAVSWLTGFVPYWSEAVLVLFHDRPPVLVVALTYRVKHWIEATSRVAEVIHTPRLGAEAGRLLAAVKVDAALAVPDLDHMPAGIVEDLRAAGPRLVVTDATSAFASLRAKADPTEIALGAKAAWIAYCALAAPSPANIGCGNLNTIIAAIEGEARRLGAEEIYIAAAPDLARDARLRRIEGEAISGKNFAVRASIAYKGTWIRLVRTFANRELIQEVARCLSTAVAGLPSDRGFVPFASWLVEGCRIAQPLEALLGSRVQMPTAPPPGALVSVQAQVQLGKEAILAGAPALLGSAGEAASLLIHPVFE
jgi:hypothetical protein